MVSNSRTLTKEELNHNGQTRDVFDAVADPSRRRLI